MSAPKINFDIHKFTELPTYSEKKEYWELFAYKVVLETTNRPFVVWFNVSINYFTRQQLVDQLEHITVEDGSPFILKWLRDPQMRVLTNTNSV